ncbi:hypothetical protein [Mycolicibacter kumamotonensis]|uniref:Uncharacterized protein n=1 Tax=Mycolicibacter kumamotonensis TaxID=354243 RepID=A0A1B8SCK8_9MYCO|nr:hypothetical protein [Mycolicibacter kumamotonensis]OBY30478.1 hypothetical protein ACT18_17690 [Mycolicibacter kumamotonensis]
MIGAGSLDMAANDATALDSSARAAGGMDLTTGDSASDDRGPRYSGTTATFLTLLVLGGGVVTGRRKTSASVAYIDALARAPNRSTRHG